MFDTAAPGVFVVTYRAAADVRPASNALLLEAIRRDHAALGAPVTVVFDVGPLVRSVDLDVPLFWLGITSETPCPIGRMGIVAQTLPVRVAARGFAMAISARSLPIEVQVFGALPEAMAWLSASGPAPTARRP